MRVSILLITLFFTSCHSFLEVNPDNRVRPEFAEDYRDIITGAYPAGEHLFTELYTDNYDYLGYNNFSNRGTINMLLPMYLWSDEYQLNSNVTPEATWLNYYNYIYKANIVLENIDDSKGSESLKRAVKGEAYLIRAYCHFMLVNIFAKHYDKNTASTDLGVPYMFSTEKSNMATYERDNVQFVYDNVEKDIMMGIDLLDESTYKVPSRHFSKQAAYAFLSRFYLYKGEWDNCIEFSEKLFEENYSIRAIIADYDAAMADNAYVAKFRNLYFSEGKQNVLLMNYGLDWISYDKNGFYGIDLRTRYHNDDQRLRLFTYNNGGSESIRNYSVNKYVKFLANDGNRYSNICLFSVEEVIYNAAEASLRKTNPDLEYAATKLNDIISRRFRINPPLVSTSVYDTDQELLEKVLLEKNLELCWEGLRWFDIKRHGISVTHFNGSRNITLAPDDLRRIVQIPPSELTNNNKMVPNPR